MFSNCPNCDSVDSFVILGNKIICDDCGTTIHDITYTEIIEYTHEDFLDDVYFDESENIVDEG